MRLTLRVSEKDTLIRRWLELAHERGDSVSEYVTIAIRYYLKYKEPIILGSVRQAAYSNSISTSFLVPDYIVDELDELAKQFGNYKRSRLIKTILSRCITLKKGYEAEEMTNLYELMDVVIHMNDEESKSTAPEENTVQYSNTLIVDQSKSVIEEKVVEKTRDEDKIEEKVVKKEEGSKKTGNKLLGGLFPDIQDQLADWE